MPALYAHWDSRAQTWVATCPAYPNLIFASPSAADSLAGLRALIEGRR